MGARRPRRSAIGIVAALVAVELLAAGGSVTGIEAAALAGPPKPGSGSSVHSGTSPVELLVVRPSARPDPTPARRPVRFLLVDIERAVPITTRPGSGRTIGTMPAGSPFYGVPTVAWVRDVSRDGRFGLVDLPYVPEHGAGWIRLRGLDRSWTRVRVVADLSDRRLVVVRGRRVLLRAPAATGAPGSTTPTGRYFVTDRIAFPRGGALGTFAFGISGIQPNLPAGWSGGNQLAIHGTDVPSSIGRPASAGCLRVAEHILDLLKPLLRLGTPVIVRP
jgi:lipoprotein-anchoring transpeptidase ErfK/SrfK